MLTPEPVSRVVAFIILFFFWIFAGLLMAPFWALVVLIGALLGAFKWEETPRVFWELITIRWFFN